VANSPAASSSTTRASSIPGNFPALGRPPGTDLSALCSAQSPGASMWGPSSVSSSASSGSAPYEIVSDTCPGKVAPNLRDKMSFARRHSPSLSLTCAFPKANCNSKTSKLSFSI